MNRYIHCSICKENYELYEHHACVGYGELNGYLNSLREEYRLSPSLEAHEQEVRRDKLERAERAVEAAWERNRWRDMWE